MEKTYAHDSLRERLQGMQFMANRNSSMEIELMPSPLLLHLLNNRLNTLYLFASHISKQTLYFVSTNSNVGITFLYVDAANVVVVKVPFLAEKAQDVAFANLVFLTLTYI